MPPLALRLLAARYALGLFTSADLTRVADDLLGQGIYSPSLGELVLTRYPIWAEVGPRFAAALGELGVAVPSFQAAARTLVGFCLRDVAEERLPPGDALHRFRRELHQSNDFGLASDVVDAAACGDLLGGTSNYDELIFLEEEGFLDRAAADERRVALQREDVRLAQRWVRRYGATELDPAWLAWDGGCVPRLAREIRVRRHFRDLPILADALEEAGCTDLDLLQHCREADGHRHFCWAVATVLARRAAVSGKGERPSPSGIRRPSRPPPSAPPRRRRRRA